MKNTKEKLELIDEIIELNENYLVIDTSFRLKKEDGDFKIVEFFPDWMDVIHGWPQDDMIWDWFNNLDTDIEEFITDVGFYDCIMLFTFDSDGDDFNTWRWLELEAIKVSKFTKIETRLKEEYDWFAETNCKSTAELLPF